jgi:hypothetical protein
MTKLTPYAQSALNKVREKHSAYRIARETIMAELDAILEQRLESYVAERDVAVRLADEAGVPRTQIGKSMGTTNYRTVQDILERAGYLPVSSTSDPSGDSWKLLQDGTGWLLVIKDFGEGSVSGSAYVAVEDGELIFVDGDNFVLSQVYRAGVAPEVIAVVNKTDGIA